MAKYLGLQEDGLLFSFPEENTFIEKYEQKWSETMSDVYFQSEAIDIGHKLRPRLVFWGYISNAEPSPNESLDDVAQIAVCVELIHKASLLIDDYIDKDTARHSRPAFYIEHGVERTVIFSLNILSKSLELLNKTFYKRNNINSFYYKSLNDITITLQKNDTGGIKRIRFRS